jgi:nucleotide-binding universal stress UspA family protein
MAKRRTSPGDIPDALREAVERTVEVTRGSAQETRDRAQSALDEVVDTLGRSRSAVLGAIEERRPATQEDVKELRAELRKIGRRLDAIEERLPKGPSSSKD